jgi:hypothetical protein
MDMEQKMTRDETRALFAGAGLTYAALTQDSVQRLRAHINRRMQSSDLMKGTFRCKQRGSVRKKDGNTHYVQIRCRSYYFEDREAVTFNPDGFIGFGGCSSAGRRRPQTEGSTFCKRILRTHERRRFDIPAGGLDIRGPDGLPTCQLRDVMQHR